MNALSSCKSCCLKLLLIYEYVLDTVLPYTNYNFTVYSSCSCGHAYAVIFSGKYTKNLKL